MRNSAVPGGSLLAIIKRDWRNPPNLVTGSRMIGALGIPFLALSESKKKQWAGLGLFAFVAATDKLDGWMAKNVYGSTELGKMLDPAADKELIFISLGTLLAKAQQEGDRPTRAALLAALPTLLAREVAVVQIKAKAQRQSEEVESAIQSGRVSMVAQSVAVGALLIPTNGRTSRWGKIGLLGAAVGASLYSWADYRRRYRNPDL